MTEIGTLRVKLELDTSEWDKQFERIMQQLSELKATRTADLISEINKAVSDGARIKC